jgi:hypothetical protein
MSYTLHFSDPNTTTTITVPSKSVTSTGLNDYDTSLQLIGAGYQNYGLPTAQNFLKLLENFAGPAEPAHPIKGQLWYDTSNSSRPVLRINNGAQTSGRWPSANGVYQQITDPAIRYTSITDGDIWVDIASNQLKIRFGNDWTIVGPGLLTGVIKTGAESVIITSSDNQQYPVLKMWANGKLVEIISSYAFTPKTVISGFTTIAVGVNLNSKIAAKYNGTTEKALLLDVPYGTALGASDLLKNRVVSQTHTGTFYVESLNGLYIKPTSTANPIKLSTDVNNNGFINYYGSTLKLGLQDYSYLKFSYNYSSIGINKDPTSTSPALDVAGGARFSDIVTLSSTNTTALVVAGGGVFNGRISSNDLTVTGNISATGKLTIGATPNDNIAIIPTATNVYDIGSASSKFRTIYVSEIKGVPLFDGSITGGAGRLVYPRTLNIIGEVTATTVVTFDGTSDVTFSTVLTRNSINNQDTTSTTTATQTLLILNTATNTSELEKISKSDFLADVYAALYQPGMIVAYGTSTNIPSGFLKCDGGTQLVSNYRQLYAVIGTIYGNAGAGTFKTPDMRTTTSVSPGGNLTYIIKT